MKALVIFSGGQDSTTCLGWARSHFEEVEAITFFYGQKHEIELKQARIICSVMKVKQTEVDLSFLPALVDSALTSSGNVNESHKRLTQLPASFVPNRNALFLTLAHAYAQKIGADNLVMGVCETDFSGYPDCRMTFIAQMSKALNEGSSSEILVHAPLMFKNKAQIFQMAEEERCLEEVIVFSHTCYNGDRLHGHEWGYGCGECPACKLRMKGYEEFQQLKNK